MATLVETYECGEPPWSGRIRDGSEDIVLPVPVTCDPTPEGLKLGGGLAGYFRVLQRDCEQLDVWVTSAGDVWVGIMGRNDELMVARAPMAVPYLLCGFAAMLGVARVAKLRLYIEDFVKELDSERRVRAENGSMYIEGLTDDGKWGRMHAQPPMQEETIPAARPKRRSY